MVYGLGTMPRKVPPGSEFGARLYRLRRAAGLTQIQLAEAIGSSQRAVSRYETVAEYPPAPAVIDLAKALGVTTDELLGVASERKPRRVDDDPEVQRLWKKFLQMRELPEKDQKAIIRMINSLVSTRNTGVAAD